MPSRCVVCVCTSQLYVKNPKSTQQPRMFLCSNMKKRHVHVLGELCLDLYKSTTSGHFLSSSTIILKNKTPKSYGKMSMCGSALRVFISKYQKDFENARMLLSSKVWPKSLCFLNARLQSHKSRHRASCIAQRPVSHFYTQNRPPKYACASPSSALLSQKITKATSMLCMC